MQEVFRRACGWTMLLLALGLTACERDSNPPSKPAAPKSPPAQVQDRVALPAQKPQYTFAAGLAERQPEIVSFMRHLLETCLAGDYSGYRRLVARATEPESRARFERILHALRAIHIESIEEVALREVPSPTYLVVGKADLQPDEKVARRRPAGPRRIGILVLQEEGEWRVALAPPPLQPDDETDATSAPTTTSAPSYSWDEDGDY